MATYVVDGDGTWRCVTDDTADTHTAAAPTSETAHGWRVWYTRPAEKQLTLYSPIYGTRLQGVEPSTCRTTSRVMRAVCAARRHEPPAAGCACGVYAVANVVDALYRVRAMTANIRGGDAYNSWFPYAPDRGMVPVLAEVTLYRAADHDDVGTWSILSKAQRQIGISTPVIRAAKAEIKRLYVPDEMISAATADRTAQRLAVDFGVEAVSRDYPEYTAADWDSRPQWMREEPWRSWYAVDTMLAGFSRNRHEDVVRPLHVVFVCTNNYVRSPMAAIMFAHQIAERGLADRVRVSSAGTFDDPRLGTSRVGGGIAEWAGRVLRSHGYPTEHRAAVLTAEHLGADLVVATADQHARKLARLGVPAGRLRLLRSFDLHADTLDVEDPAYNHQIEHVYTAIAASLPGLHEWVDTRLSP